MENLIKSIISLPEKCNVLGNVSIYSLLKETGYFEFYNQVNEVDIRNELNMYPEYINSWFIWSEDKRSASGWYLTQNENRKYEVGYFPDQKENNAMEYSDVKEACAVFIKREIEEIRKA